MNRRTLPHLLLGVLLVLVASPVHAAPRDAAAKKQIDEAINKHYFATEFDKAEARLMGAISACGGQCSGPVVAKAWMYVGIVRGGGKNDQKGAREAFANALAADPQVALDEALATDTTKKTFAAAKQKRGGGAAGGDGAGGGGGPMDCSPKLSEVQTRRPIPISCTADESARRVDLQYKAGGEDWKRIRMKSKHGVFQATIPCTATRKAGTLRFFVRAHDEEGAPLAAYGKKAKPIEVSVAKETDEEPPAFPDQEPPHRCSRAEVEGAASCESDDDCEGDATCQEGSCEAKSKKKKGGPYKENWFGLHGAFDLAIVGGSDVCSRDGQQNKGFACFYKGTETQYRFNTQPNYNNNVNTGVALATYRGLISFDRLVSANISVGLRVGYALGGGPPSGKAKDAKFLPLHAELRASYWPGESPFSTSGFRPYVGVQAGAAQIDAKLPVKVGDCGGTQGGAPSKPGDSSIKDPTFYDACSNGTAAGPPLELDAYRRLGQAFVGVHAGIVYAPTPDNGIQLNLNVMQMMPTSGQAIEPSLGYVIGL